MDVERPLIGLAANELLGISVDAIVSAMVRAPKEAPMPVAAHIVHRVPGRVRMRIPHRRDHHEFFADVEKRLSQCAGITNVSTNPSTGSMLVRFEGDLETVLAQAAAAGLAELLDISDSLPPTKPVGEALLERLQQTDARIVTSTGGAMNGGSVVLVGLLAAALLQLWRGQTFGPAVPLLWYAAQALRPLTSRAQAARSS
jgi:hypothetical protein